MRYFGLSLIVTIIGIILASLWGLRINPSIALESAFIVIVLGIMEVSLSFDNAVVNATKLDKMTPKWRKRFLLWGILIAVFGMRFTFPMLVVSVFSHLSIPSVIKMAFHDPVAYSLHLELAKAPLSAFGGTFLFMIFLGFLFDEEKEKHWVPWIEKTCSNIGGKEGQQTGISLMAITALSLCNHQNIYVILISALAGLVLYMIIEKIGDFISNDKIMSFMKTGIISFLYLELIDASFSFDGVMGAFAISRDIVLIAIGLGIGAMFVRSLTLYLVDKKVLKEYAYLEHGAMWAIGILAGIMFVSTKVNVPELVTGLIGAGLITIAVICSVIETKREKAKLISRLDLADTLIREIKQIAPGIELAEVESDGSLTPL